MSRRPGGAPPDRVLLVGMMGAGKTTVGQRLATTLGWRYLDNDVVLRQEAGLDTRRLHETAGVGALRRAESEALTNALTVAGPVVAGVAGGVVLDPLDRERLRAGAFVVWLRASIDTLARRVAGTDRPWLAAAGTDGAGLPGGVRRAVTALYAGRADLYASVADVVVDVDMLPADAVAARIASAL